MALQKITDSALIESITGNEYVFLQKDDKIVKAKISYLFDTIRLPIAKCSDYVLGNGDEHYSAYGDDLPEVIEGSSSAHVGKGKQIVFIPYNENQTEQPKLSLNDGHLIEIRLRADRNQSDNEQSPEATLPVPVGTLIRGVPYTLTFCGRYWLVDSYINRKLSAHDIAGLQDTIYDELSDALQTAGYATESDVNTLIDKVNAALAGLVDVLEPATEVIDDGTA